MSNESVIPPAVVWLYKVREPLASCSTTRTGCGLSDCGSATDTRKKRCPAGDGSAALGEGSAWIVSSGSGDGLGVGVGGAPPLTCKLTRSLGWRICPGGGSCATTMPLGLAPTAMGRYLASPSSKCASFAACLANSIESPMKLGVYVSGRPFATTTSTFVP